MSCGRRKRRWRNSIKSMKGGRSEKKDVGEKNRRSGMGKEKGEMAGRC